MTAVNDVKAVVPTIVKKYTQRSNSKAFVQVLNTLVPYFLLFYFSMETMAVSGWISALFILLLSFITLRIFVLMHDCGHKSMFRTPVLNSIFGFVTGVLTGMPQYVWSEHHNYHHRTNGDWEKYRGPLNIITVRDYEQLSASGKRKYRYSRNIWLAPLGAFMYFIFNPRFNWMVGSIRFAASVLLKKIRQPGERLRDIISRQESRVWADGRQYLHMTLNNIVLLSLWLVCSMTFGVTEFFVVVISSLSLAGAMGLILFTVQHNFKDSYASDTEHHDFYRAAMEGTSFLILPKILNWFCADIVYHHIHHLSAGIPNYNLEQCHKEYAHMFEGVKQISLGEIVRSFSYILWDEDKQFIVAIDAK